MKNISIGAPKKRGRQDHFTPQEIEIIRRAFVDGRKISDVCLELNASARNIVKYYGFFRAGGQPQRKQKQTAIKKTAKSLPDRFYHSNFEPS